jgi:hypothetical protein
MVQLIKQLPLVLLTLNLIVDLSSTASRSASSDVDFESHSSSFYNPSEASHEVLLDDVTFPGVKTGGMRGGAHAGGQNQFSSREGGYDSRIFRDGFHQREQQKTAADDFLSDIQDIQEITLNRVHQEARSKIASYERYSRAASSPQQCGFTPAPSLLQPAL